MSLADELAAAGGVQAPPQATARLKDLLGDTLRQGAAELGRALAQVGAEQVLEAGRGLRRRLDPAGRGELDREDHRWLR